VDVILEMSAQVDDPTVRVLTARGRWSMKGFSVRYRGDAFDLTAGELTPDARVLLHVEQNPGVSKRRVRDQVGGRAQVVDASLEALEARGAIERREDGYYPVSQTGNRDTVRDTGVCPTQVVVGQGRDTVADTGCVPIPNPRVEMGHTCVDCGGPTEPGATVYAELLCNRCAVVRGSAEVESARESKAA